MKIDVKVSANIEFNGNNSKNCRKKMSFKGPSPFDR